MPQATSRHTFLKAGYFIKLPKGNPLEEMGEKPQVHTSLCSHTCWVGLPVLEGVETSPNCCARNLAFRPAAPLDDKARRFVTEI